MLRCPLSRQEAVPGQQGKGWHVRACYSAPTHAPWTGICVQIPSWDTFSISFSKKTQPNKKFATALSWQWMGFTRASWGSSPPQFGAKASPCSLIRLEKGEKVAHPHCTELGSWGCPAAMVECLAMGGRCFLSLGRRRGSLPSLPPSHQTCVYPRKDYLFHNICKKINYKYF